MPWRRRCARPRRSPWSPTAPQPHRSSAGGDARRCAHRLAASVTEEIFARTLPIDYTHLEQAGRTLAAKLTEAKLCRVTGAGGTMRDSRLRRITRRLGTPCRAAVHRVREGTRSHCGRRSGGRVAAQRPDLAAGRQPICDDGDLRAPCAWGNLPAGEAFITPLVSDGSGHSMPAARTGGRSPSWGSARIRAPRPRGSSSRTRRRRGRFTSPSAPTRALAAPIGRPFTSTGSYARRWSNSTAVPSCATGVLSTDVMTTLDTPPSECLGRRDPGGSDTPKTKYSSLPPPLGTLERAGRWGPTLIRISASRGTIDMPSEPR
jgi:hypothetical protein